MTREEAIKYFENGINTNLHLKEKDRFAVGIANENIEAYSMAISALSENKGEWIPVSERLPDKNMVCIVAVGQLNMTQMAIYSDLMGTIDHRIFYQGDVGHESFRDITEYVKAWMPLPEPYKERGE